MDSIGDGGEWRRAAGGERNRETLFVKSEKKKR